MIRKISQSEEISLGGQIRLAPNPVEQDRDPEESVLRFLENENLEEETTFRWNGLRTVVDLALSARFAPLALIFSLTESYLLNKGGTIEVFATKSGDLPG